MLARLALSSRSRSPPAPRSRRPRAYPAKPIRVIVPTVAGGALDNVARMVGQRMSERLGQQLVVENRGGAGGVIGMDAVAKSAPDGYTVCFCAAPIALNTALGMKLPYDAERDFAPVSLVASIPALIAVHPSTPYRSIKDVLDAAAATPGGVTFAYANVGAITHLIGEALKAKTGANMTGIAYKGAGQAIQDVLSGRVPIFFDAYIPTGPQVQAGKLRAIAIASSRRSPLLPDVATVVEQGYPELVGSGFYGMAAPGKTPRPIVDKLHAAARRRGQPDRRAREAARAGVRGAREHPGRVRRLHPPGDRALDAGREGGGDQGRAVGQSTRAPTSFATFDHFAISARMNSPNSSGVRDDRIEPALDEPRAHVGHRHHLRERRDWSCLTTSGGSPAGPAMPCHARASKPG